MKHKILSLQSLIWFCAIGLASFSGYYSVYGISKLFSGGSWSIIGMAAMLEFSKLVVITFLHDYYKTLKTAFKLYLMSSAVVLMVLTSVGVYGYLTNSYQETAKSIYETQNKIALLEQKKKIFTEQKTQIDTLVKQKTERISSYDKLRLSQESSLNSQLNLKKGTKGLQKNIQSVDQSTQTLNGEISQLNQKSIGLSDSVALLEQEKLVLENSTFTSEIGPLLYLSRLTGKPMDIIVNWFILILVSVFDPLAVSLVIAANHLKNKEKEKTLVVNKVESQITDAVTTHQIINEVNEPIQENIELNTMDEDIILDKNEEKKSFDLKEESVIFDEFKNEQDEFYEEPEYKSYRRSANSLNKI